MSFALPSACRLSELFSSFSSSTDEGPGTRALHPWRTSVGTSRGMFDKVTGASPLFHSCFQVRLRCLLGITILSRLATICVRLRRLGVVKEFALPSAAVYHHLSTISSPGGLPEGSLFLEVEACLTKEVSVVSSLSSVRNASSGWWFALAKSSTSGVVVVETGAWACYPIDCLVHSLSVHSDSNELFFV
jgi:hypothetical protein